jgi:phospho-N-acetylmuramoyl-pentapeptide-transferase
MKELLVDQILIEAAKLFTFTAVSYLIAIWWAPYLIQLLVFLKFWKKKSRFATMTGEELTVTKEFYKQDEAKLQVPRAGGLLIWITTISFAIFLWLLLKIEPTVLIGTEPDNKTFEFLNFISRRQTFIPIATLFFASVLGFIDDALAVMQSGGNYFAGGLKLNYRVFAMLALSVGVGLWFHLRLGLDQISIFGYHLKFADIQLPFGISSGWLIVLVTIGVLMGLWGSSMIDGFDGMSAGVFIPIYLCFAAISFAKGFYDISTFLMVMVGAMAAYLWYNIPPAKFYMGDTGTMGILATLGVVAIMTDTIYILPIAGFILLLTEASVIIQTLSKKIFKRKVFLAAPLHHHLEAIGWTKSQITMRYWLISIMSSVLALAIGLLYK